MTKNKVTLLPLIIAVSMSFFITGCLNDNPRLNSILGGLGMAAYAYRELADRDDTPSVPSSALTGELTLISQYTKKTEDGSGEKKFKVFGLVKNGTSLTMENCYVTFDVVDSDNSVLLESEKANCFPPNLSSGETGVYVELIDNSNEIYNDITNVTALSSSSDLDIENIFGKDVGIAISGIENKAGTIHFTAEVSNISGTTIELNSGHDMYVAGFDSNGALVDISFSSFSNLVVPDSESAFLTDEAGTLDDPEQSITNLVEVTSIQQHGLFIMGLYEIQ